MSELTELVIMEFSSDPSTIVYYLLLSFFWYHAFTMTAAASVAAVQEAKIWKAGAHLPPLSLLGHVKVVMFNVVWMTICLLGSILICLKWALTLGRSDIEADAYRYVERYAAKAIIAGFVGRVQVVGMDNLPPPDVERRKPAPVFIANHASQIDSAVVYYLERRFKWTMKSSILFLPGVGPLIGLAGHVLINRKRAGKGKSSSNSSSKDESGKKKSSSSSLSLIFAKSNDAIQSGIPMFFFPQGTRRMSERLPLKDGAFIVAETNQTPLIPISIDIPTRTNPWNTLYPLNLLWGGRGAAGGSNSSIPTIKLTVHKPIPYDANVDRETTKKKCSDIIYSVLPPSMYGEGEETDKNK